MGKPYPALQTVQGSEKQQDAEISLRASLNIRMSGVISLKNDQTNE